MLQVFIKFKGMSMGTVLVENVYALLSIREPLVTAKGLKELAWIIIGQVPLM